MSWISLGQNIAPSLAPTVGGFLGEWASWRATFWFVGGFGSILFLVTLAGLRETNKFRSERIDLSSLLRGSARCCATAASSATSCRWVLPSR